MEYAKKIKLLSTLSIAATLAIDMLRQDPESDVRYVFERAWQMLITDAPEDFLEWIKIIESGYFPPDPLDVSVMTLGSDN